MVPGELVPGKLIPGSTPAPRFLVSEFWVCFEHSTLTSRCSTPAPRFFCFRVLGLFASSGFVSNIPRTHHDAQRPPHDFLFPSFGFVCHIFLATILPGTNFLGINFPGTIFPGDNFSRDHFSWGSFFPGIIFPVAIFPGIIFPGFLKLVLSKNFYKNLFLSYMGILYIFFKIPRLRDTKRPVIGTFTSFRKYL